MALPAPLYPPQAWRITEPSFDPVRRNETIFSLGNGTIGLRGGFEEGFRGGFAALLGEQEQALSAFWRVADVEVDGDLSLQQGLRFNLWSLLQSAGHDGRTSVAAKGLSGEGYEGHYFWDTEIYVFPYTNLMARENLAYAAEVAGELRAREPREFRRIAGAIGLADAEIEGWRQAAAKMLVSRDPQRGIHVQDDSFLDRAPWDFAGTPAEKYPLLLHYHPLVIYRHQVLKQPDVVLAQVLLSHLFSRAEKKRNFDFYNPLTTATRPFRPASRALRPPSSGTPTWPSSTSPARRGWTSTT